MMPALRHQVGQLFLVGLGGTTLDPVERSWIKLMRPAGFILFRRNIEDAAATTALLADATRCAGSEGEQVPAFRALDLEGGLVDRLRDLVAPMPSAAAVAATSSVTNAHRHGELIGRAARLLGFNTVFAPVLDLALPAALPVMRTRVYGETSEAVVQYARPFLQGLRAERVVGSGKHFPGLGGGDLDSHHATPHIRRSWQELWDQDMAPYRELMPLLPIIMVSHACYPKVHHAGERPASVSRFWIHDTLRKRMGYTGIILSDDMEMGGLLTQMPMEEAAVEAIAAGTDLLEICQNPALVLSAYEAVLREAEASPSFRRLVRAAYARIVAHKGTLLETQLPRTASADQLVRLRTDILLFATGLDAINRAERRAE